MYFGSMPGKDVLYWKVQREGKLKDCFTNFPLNFDTVKKPVCKGFFFPFLTPI